MHDKQAACIRCATGAALHSMGLRTEALARSQISGNPKPRYLKADEYTDALIKVATHNKYASVSDWTNSIEDAAHDLMGFEVEDKTSNETKPNPAKAKGIKATCSLTKYLPCCGEYIQVAYDTEENEVFGIRQTQNSWTVFKDDSIVEVANYYRPTTMKQITQDLLIALGQDQSCADILL